MKTMILVALAVLSLGVGNAYTQGQPLSAHAGVYGSQYLKLSPTVNRTAFYLAACSQFGRLSPGRAQVMIW